MAIVTINVSVQVGATPSTFQQTGALVSTGGTTLANNASSLLTQLSDLTPLLAGGIAITSATEASTTVTITTTTAHGFTTGDQVVIAGFTTPGYNGTWTITVTGAEAFTYTTSSGLTTPAVGTGVVTDQDVAELVAMYTTYLAQGNQTAVYVLELGHGTAVANVAALSAYLTANPASSYYTAPAGTVFYRYLVPRGFDAQSTFVTLVNGYTSNTAKQYFHVTATLSTYSSFTASVGKGVLMTIEAPTIGATEFTSAMSFAVQLGYAPSSTNQVTPLEYAFAFGCTAYPVTPTQVVTFNAANLNYITSGAEGGISNLMLVNGNNADGNPANYWYSIDYTQIQMDQAISNEIINGSNDPQAPLYYDQPGINRLQSRAVKTANNIVAVGLAIGPVFQYQMTNAAFTAFLGSGQAPIGFLINAVPFASWVALNPNTYNIGQYGGLAADYTPQRGFSNIVFNIGVVQP
jgi:hypothetical protein